MIPQDTDPLRAKGTDREPYAGWTLEPAGRTPAGTRVTWFVLGVCVGVLLAVVGMAGIAEAASRTAPDTVPAHSGAPQGLGTSATLVDPASSAVELYRSDGPVHDLTGGVPLTPKRPTATLAGPLISGETTWCAPTPDYCQSWGHGRLLGAVHSFRWGDEPYRVRVWRGERSVTVRIVSYCACLNRSDTIDLSVAAAKAVEPDWRRLGRFAVELEVLRP